jgi:hypothetical protein
MSLGSSQSDLADWTMGYATAFGKMDSLSSLDNKIVEHWWAVVVVLDGLVFWQ